MLRPGARVASLLLAAALLALGEGGCPTAPDPTPAAAPAAASSAATLLIAQDRRIEAQARRVQARPRSPLEAEKLASLRLVRHRLSGRFEDLVAAAEDAERARTLPRWSPSAVAAEVALALHDLGEADALLTALSQRVLVDQQMEAWISSAQAQVAHARGAFDDARRLHEAALAQRRSPETLGAFALFLWKTGDLAGADAALAEALATASSGDHQLRAWAGVQRARMRVEVGDRAGAARQIAAAEAALPGWWQTDALRAQLLAAEGDGEGARTLLESLVERTGDPELREALAQDRFARGDVAGAGQALAAARSEWESRWAQRPLAIASHLAAHLLLTAADAPRAVALAEADAAVRPGADGPLLLARARAASGDCPGALGAVAALPRAWMGPAALRAAAEVASTCADEARAAGLREEATHRARVVLP